MGKGMILFSPWLWFFFKKSSPFLETAHDTPLPSWPVPGSLTVCLECFDTPHHSGLVVCPLSLLTPCAFSTPSWLSYEFSEQSVLSVSSSVPAPTSHPCSGLTKCLVSIYLIEWYETILENEGKAFYFNKENRK